MPLHREEIATISLTSKVGQEGVVIVNTVPEDKQIGVCVSSRENGDAEVWMSTQDCSRLIDALQEALRQVS